MDLAPGRDGRISPNRSIASMRSLKPDSFMNSLIDIQSEVEEIQLEFAFVKKELENLRSEKEDIVAMSSSQSKDIRRYLKRELNILSALVDKQEQMQQAENRRLRKSCCDADEMLKWTLGEPTKEC